MPKLVVHKRAARYLRRMDAWIKAQLVAKFGELAQNPDYRTSDTIVIAHVGHRGDVHK